MKEIFTKRERFWLEKLQCVNCWNVNFTMFNKLQKTMQSRNHVLFSFYSVKMTGFATFLLFKKVDFLNWNNSSFQILIWKNYKVSDFQLKNKQRVIIWNFELNYLQPVRLRLKSFTTTRFWRKLWFQGVPSRLLLLQRSDRFFVLFQRARFEF